MGIRHTLYRLKYRYGQHLPLKVPVDVSLELASHCNMRCAYCYHADQKNLGFTKDYMTLSTATVIIDQAAEFGVSSLKFNWKGESTLNPMFSRILHHAAKYNFVEKIINSNFKFTKRRDEILEALCTLDKVKISFDSFRKDVFETQRAGGKWHITCDNINRFYNHPLRNKTKIVIQAVRTNLNKDEDIAGQVRERWPEAEVSIRDMVSGRVDKDLTGLENKERKGERQSCLQAHVRLIFNKEGYVFPCCPDIKEKMCFGNIWDEDIEGLFSRGRSLRKDLKNLSAFDRDPCKNCSSFETFVGYKPSWQS